MSDLKFMDGSPVPDEYMNKLQPLLDAANEAERLFTIDELEEYSGRNS